MAQSISPCIALIAFSGSVEKLKNALVNAVKNGAPTHGFRVRTYGSSEIDRFREDIRKPEIQFHGVVLSANSETLSNMWEVSCSYSERDYMRDVEPIFDFIRMLVAYEIRRVVSVMTDGGIDAVEEMEEILCDSGLIYEQFAVTACSPERYERYGTEYEEKVFDLIKKINQVIIEPAIKEETFLMPISQILKIKNMGVAAIGRAMQSSLKVGSDVEIVGYGKRAPAKVVGLSIAGKSVAEINAGENAGIILTGVDGADIHKGQMVALPGLIEMKDILRAKIYVSGEQGDRPRALFSNRRLSFSTDYLEMTSNVLIEGDNVCEYQEYACVEIRLIQEIPYVKGMKFRLGDKDGTIAIGTVL